MGFRIAQLSVKGPTLPFARDRTSCGIDTGCGLLLFVALMILLSNLVTKRAYPPEGRRTGAASPISSTFWLQIAGRCGEVANCLAQFVLPLKRPDQTSYRADCRSSRSNLRTIS